MPVITNCLILGTKIKLADAMYCGVGTHFVPSSAIETLRHDLCSSNISSHKDVENILNSYNKPVPGMFFLLPFLC